MSVTTRSPLRMAGANLSSGHPATGEVPWTRGGQLTATLWSGGVSPNLTGAPTGAVTSGGHTLILTGAGRLNTILPHSFLTSGQPVFFYDAGAISVSGVSVSGQRIIGIVPNTMRAPLAALSGNIATVVNWEDKIDCDMPFTSGLCVAAASGAPGVTVSYTPEVNVNFN